MYRQRSHTSRILTRLFRVPELSRARRERRDHRVEEDMPSVTRGTCCIVGDEAASRAASSMRAEGLEPPSLAAPAPKAGVSANFTTPAAGLHPTSDGL